LGEVLLKIGKRKAAPIDSHQELIVLIIVKEMLQKWVVLNERLLIPGETILCSLLLLGMYVKTLFRSL